MQNLQNKFPFVIFMIIQLDIFGQSVTLNINRQKTYTTIFGGFSSIFIIAILIAYFQSNIISFLNKSDVIFSTETFNEYQIIWLHFQLNKKIIYRILCLILKQNKEITLEINQVINKKKLHIHIWNLELQIIFNFFQINLDLNMLVLNNPKKQENLNKEGQFKLQIYQVNNVINPNSPEQIIIINEKIFNYNPILMEKCILLLFHKSFQGKQICIIENMIFKIITHQCHFSIYLVQSYLISQFIHRFRLINEKELIVRQRVDYRDLTEIGRDTDNNYAIVYFRRSQFSEYINRRFIKIDELLSILGRIFINYDYRFWNIYHVLINIMQLIHHILVQIELFNKLYIIDIQFQINNKFSIISLKNLIKHLQLRNLQNKLQMNKKRILQRLLSNQIKEQNKKIVQQMIQIKQEFQQKIFNLYEKSIKLRLTQKSLINYFSFGYLFDNTESKIFKKAQSLDIQEILYQLQEQINQKLQFLIKIKLYRESIAFVVFELRLKFQLFLQSSNFYKIFYHYFYLTNENLNYIKKESSKMKNNFQVGFRLNNIQLKMRREDFKKIQQYKIFIMHGNKQNLMKMKILVNKNQITNLIKNQEMSFNKFFLNEKKQKENVEESKDEKGYLNQFQNQ